MFDSILISHDGEIFFFELMMRDKRIKVKISEEKCISPDKDLLYSGLGASFDIEAKMKLKISMKGLTAKIDMEHCKSSSLIPNTRLWHARMIWRYKMIVGIEI